MRFCLFIAFGVFIFSCKQKEFTPPPNKTYTTNESIEIKKEVLQILAKEEKRLLLETKQQPRNEEFRKMYAFVIQRQKALHQELNELRR